MERTKNGEELPVAGETRRRRIIDAALEEFVRRGYKNANTNRIVEAAGVSKGLLFHYFGSKKDLYLYLCEYTMDLLVDEFFDVYDTEDKQEAGDLFERCKEAVELKYALIEKHGRLFEFALNACVRPPEEVKERTDPKTMQRMVDAWRRLIKNVDASAFREDIDPGKAIKIIYWVIEGYSAEQMDPAMRMDNDEREYANMMKELGRYLDLLRQLMYKPERL